MGQEPELARMAQTYIIIAIPNIYITYANTAIRKFLQSIGKIFLRICSYLTLSIGEMRITMYLIFLLFPINIISNYFFLIYLDLAYIGASLHVMAVSFLFLIFNLIYLTYSNSFKAFWPGFTKDAFRNWGQFLKLGNKKTKINDSKNLNLFLKKVFPAC